MIIQNFVKEYNVFISDFKYFYAWNAFIAPKMDTQVAFNIFAVIC